MRVVVHPRTASSCCSRFSTFIASKQISRPANRAHNSSLASGTSSSQEIYPKLSTTYTSRYTLTKGQEVQTSQKISIPPRNGWRPLHYSKVDRLEVITPLFRYQELLQTGVLRGDEHQAQVIQKLQDLHDKIVTYTPPKVPDPPKPSGLVRLHITISCVTA